MNLSKNEWQWWKHGVIYHIYPKSFYDSNNDGIGDLQGIIHKLDYLAELGINAIWLSPVYRSPMHDHGYDIRDFTQIDPCFGNMDDFQELLNACHQRGIRLIMDLVMNHTSDKHEWFKESRSSLDNPKRDWYIWQDGKNGGPPNNWTTAFGGSAWQFDARSNQYYLHSFLKQQPDLNWRNKEMRKSYFKMIRYWLELGVDGFRLDVVNLIAKDKKFRDNPKVFKLFQKRDFNMNRPKSHKIVRRLRKLLNKYPERMSVGEIYTLPPGNAQIAASYLGNGTDALHLAFDFSLIFQRWNASDYFRCIAKWHDSIPKKGWPCHVVSNHDLSRRISRLGSGDTKYLKARIEATLLFTLKGTPFIYYGDEIGMTNVKINRKDLLDPLGKKFWPLYSGRDRSRTPMQWSADNYAGFSNAKPWLPVSPEADQVNVETQLEDPDSMLNFYRQLIQIRSNSKALMMGKWQPIQRGNSDIISYLRVYDQEKMLIVLNFSNKEKSIDLGDDHWQLVIASRDIEPVAYNQSVINLAPYQALVFRKI